MNLSAAARASVLISILSACSRPAMAQHQQHRGGGGGAHPSAGGMHPGGQMHPGGMQVHPHIQQQMQQQYRQQMQQYHQQMQQMQRQAQQQYRKDAQQFENFLKSRGQAGASSRLPKDPAGFDAWAATQKRNKAQGKSYDPLYDHFRSFAAEMGGNRGQAKAHAQAKNGRSGQEAHTAAAHHKEVATREKQAEAHHKEVATREKQAEARRRAAARTANARNQSKLPLAQDGTKIAMLRNVHANLRQADHDYDGQRVHAIHAVRQAIQHLGASPPAGNIGGGGSGLAQGRSDEILRQSLHHLRTVESQLAATGSPAHHSQARASIGQAIHHLEVALTIR